MSLKYLIEYVDLVQIPHRIEIDDPLYFGSVVNVNGFATMIYSNTNNPLEVIRGSSLRIDLDADTSLTFEDLYTEGQKKIKVKYLRNAVLKFEGWINPEGWYEDYVNDKWVVGFDCVDGLGYLKDLAFVYDIGTNIIGIKTEIELIALALQRTGLQQEIYVYIDIIYSDLSDRTGILNNVKINANRFIKDDGKTISDCDQVLRSILKKYTACLTSYNGNWYIYRPNAMVGAGDLEFAKYSYQGVYISRNTINNFNVQIGSDINNIPIHFANENQSISVKNSIGAYRISYEYGFIISLLGNENLKSTGGVIDKWTINSQNGFSIPPSELGFTLESIRTGAVLIILQLTSDVVTVFKDDDLSISFDIFADMDSNNVNLIPKILLKFILVDGGTTYWMDISGEWITTDNTLIVTATDLLTFNTKIIETGDLYIEIWTPRTDFQLFGTFDLIFNQIIIAPNKSQYQNVEGEFHDFQRTSNPSAKVEPIREVLSGDNDSGIYIGVLFKQDGITPTQSWNRENKVEDFAILRIMGEETLKMSPVPIKLFSGDIYGFIDYLSLITIDGLNGEWMPIGYNYDTRKNIISLKLIQVFNEDLTDIKYDTRLNFGNTETPTIIG